MEYFLNKPVYQHILKLLEEKADVIVLSASGSIAHFDDGAEADAVSVIAHIEPVQEGTGDPSPDNVRPITGHTEANVTVSPTTDAQDGTTYHITFPASAGTVYSGTLDVVSGLLTVDKAFAILTGASREDWRASPQSGFIGFYLNNTPTVLSGRKAGGNVVVNEFVRVQEPGWSALTAPGQLLYASNINIRVNNAVVGSTAEELCTWLANNPMEIAYELATPAVYDVTPQQIALLLGVNNVWNNCNGNTDVTYRADMKLYIDNRG